jgi:uncharacterized protein YndB with AHSA1/START domain
VSKRSSEHATFVIERSYDAPPAQVFHAWADPAAKVSWFGPSTLSADQRTQDFSVGGRERFVTGGPGGAVYSYDAVYQDIVPEQRIVYSYDMHRDEDRISVSVSTVEFEPAGEGTRLTYTEQGVYLDGHDTAASREHGTAELLGALAAALGGVGVRG